MCARRIGRICTLLLAIVLRRGVHVQLPLSGKSPPPTIEECFRFIRSTNAPPFLPNIYFTG